MRYAAVSLLGHRMQFDHLKRREFITLLGGVAGNYWSARLRDTPKLCSACDPSIEKWHGQFARESAQNWIHDKNGLLFR
jgi:hypothetical protein